MKKVIVMYGLPASGKSTQAKLLEEKYGWHHFSMGEKLRALIESGSEVGAKAKEIVENGLLVPDDIILAALGSVAEQAKTVGLVFDGFPRKQEQAVMLDELLAATGVKVSACILLEVSDETVHQRISRRLAVAVRKDDQDSAVIQNRINVFRKESLPLCAHYETQGKLYRLDGEKSIEEVFTEICKIVEAL
ncbi:MAG: adenylate kinase [Patescibacteria group bacterium]|jgi:adenylate kinase